MSAPSSGEEKKKIKRLHPPVEPDVDPEFQIAPMIDILLVLLVFFISISTTEVLQATSSVRLPIAKDAKDARPTESGQLIVNVTVDPINQIMGVEVGTALGTQRVTPNDLGAIIAAAPGLQRNPTEFRVLVRADRNVRFEYMRTILEVIGTAGVGNVTFAVVDKEGQ